HETRFTKLECDISLIKEQNSQGTDTINSQNPINLQVPILPEINSDNTPIKNISSYTDVNWLKAKSQPDKEEAINPDPIPEIEHISTQSESQITFLSIESRSDKETSIHCETNDSITSITPVSISTEEIASNYTDTVTQTNISGFNWDPSDDSENDGDYMGAMYFDDDAGYYYDLNSGKKTYKNSSIGYDLGLDVTGLDGVELGGAGLG
ncbi:21058_t:CDS:2, partial [Dentiscutata erythropus]